jgi:hypothetical protein
MNSRNTKNFKKQFSVSMLIKIKIRKSLEALNEKPLKS